MIFYAQLLRCQAVILYVLMKIQAAALLLTLIKVVLRRPAVALALTQFVPEQAAVQPIAIPVVVMVFVMGASARDVIMVIGPAQGQYVKGIVARAIVAMEPAMDRRIVLVALEIVRRARSVRHFRGLPVEGEFAVFTAARIH
jgi:hypothetical protein